MFCDTAVAGLLLVSGVCLA